MVRTKYGKTRTVKHRRHREARTNYKKRLAILKSGTHRMVVRKSLNTITTQIIEFHPDGDKVLASATSKELVKMGWTMHTGNLPSAYLTGLLLGMRAKKKNVGTAILDIGLQIPKKGGRLFAALKGAVDAGLDITHNPEALPTEERLKGAHIASYKNNDIEKIFADTKKKIMSS